MTSPYLTPALDDIERTLFEPGPDPAQSDSAVPAGLPVRESRPPAFIQRLIARRVAAQGAGFGPAPQAGQIILIDMPRPSDQGSQRRPQSPLAVLLDEPAASRDVWTGWLASPETDYAGEWDLVLQEDDGPCDPLAGMVQAWNPLSVQLPPTEGLRMLAQLGEARRRAVRALASDFARGNPLALAARPGRIALRKTSQGWPVLTGTPLGGEDDPRRGYQALYREAGNALQATVDPTPAPVAPWWERMWRAFTLYPQFTPESSLALAMGENSNASTNEGRLEGGFRVRMEASSAQVVRWRMVRESPAPHSVRLWRDGQIVQQLRGHDSEKLFLLDETGRFALEILDGEDRTLHRIDLG